MPNNDEHSSHTLHRYGVSGSDIHAWMDAPSQIYGSSHRWTRHNAKMIPKKFIEKYGEEQARAIIIDHIILDRERNRLIDEPEPLQLQNSGKITLIGLFPWILLLLLMPQMNPNSWYLFFISYTIVYVEAVFFYKQKERKQILKNRYTNECRFCLKKKKVLSQSHFYPFYIFLTFSNFFSTTN